MPKVYNIYHKNYPSDAVNCMRGSPYGNPYIMGVHGDRNEVCDLFEEKVLPTLNVNPLKGADLLCCCAPKRCHCDSILIKANSINV